MARTPDSDKKGELARRAVAVLAAEGLSLSVARLAAALGIKRPTLLYHFPTYGHLVETALEDLLRAQASFVLARVEGHPHPIDRLYAQLRAVHAFHHGSEARIVFLTQAIAAFAGPRMPHILAVGNETFARHRQSAIERVHKGIGAGTVRPCDPEALIALMRAITDGLLVQRVMTGLELAPVHALVWRNVLAPLRIPARAAEPPEHAPPRKLGSAPEKRRSPAPRLATRAVEGSRRKTAPDAAPAVPRTRGES